MLILEGILATLIILTICIILEYLIYEMVYTYTDTLIGKIFVIHCMILVAITFIFIIITAWLTSYNY